MTEKEKEAIDNLKLRITNNGFSLYDGITNIFNLKDIEIALNLISRLQKELEYKDNIINGLGTEVLPISIEGFEVLLNKTKEENDKLQKELDKKDKVINNAKNTIEYYLLGNMSLDDFNKREQELNKLKQILKE